MRLSIYYPRSETNVTWNSSGYFSMKLLPLLSELHSASCPIDQIVPGLSVESRISIRRGIRSGISG